VGSSARDPKPASLASSGSDSARESGWRRHAGPRPSARADRNRATPSNAPGAVAASPRRRHSGSLRGISGRSDDIATRGSGHCPHCAGVSRLTPGKPPEPSRHIGSWSAARPRQASSSLASRRPGISVRGRVVKRSGLRLREESKLCPIPPRRAATTVTIRFCAHPRLLGSRSLLARWKDRHQGRANCSPTGSAQQYQGSVR